MLILRLFIGYVLSIVKKLKLFLSVTNINTAFWTYQKNRFRTSKCTVEKILPQKWYCGFHQYMSEPVNFSIQTKLVWKGNDSTDSYCIRAIIIFSWHTSFYTNISLYMLNVQNWPEYHDSAVMIQVTDIRKQNNNVHTECMWPLAFSVGGPWTSCTWIPKAQHFPPEFL